MIYRFREKHVNHHATDEPTIDPFGNKNASHYATDEPTIYRFIMVSVLVSKAVDHGFIGGVLAFLCRER
jgi:hypothetical protein